MFKAEQFDPASWAHLFSSSGAKYVVPVFEHHDVFAMYNTKRYSPSRFIGAYSLRAAGGRTPPTPPVGEPLEVRVYIPDSI